MSRHLSCPTGENAAVAKRVKAAASKREAAREPGSQNHFAVFTEWTGEADEKAYADL
jgi:hypothetical protein